MKRKLIAANWKMNILRDEAEILVNSIVDSVNFPLECDVMIAPPYTCLDIVRKCIVNTDIELGAQDVFWEDKGAYTGEISPSMLIDAGCEWVILGHSERRAVIGESDNVIEKKLKKALRKDLKVILCIGETESQRIQNRVSEILGKQLTGVLGEIESEYSEKIAIAYEPVWAIGTGVNAKSEQILEAHSIINDNLIELFEKDAHNIRILYGGSVKENNIKEIVSIKNVDGALVGGASLESVSFKRIIENSGVC